MFVLHVILSLSAQLNSLFLDTRLPNLYSWFNHHGVAIKHLTLNNTVSFEGTLTVDNIPGVPLTPPARRGGVSLPVIGLIFSLCQVNKPQHRPKRIYALMSSVAGYRCLVAQPQ